jgi:hypothetical protein
VNVQRPGGSFHSDTFAQRVARPAPAARGFVPTGHRGGYGPRGPVFVERNVFVNNRGPGWGPALAIGGGLFGLGLFAGSALASPPPPPVYVAPAPVYVTPAQPPVVVYNPPQPYTVTPTPPPTVVVDPVRDAVGRLSSNHGNSRREGAYTLGRLRDPRAVPALVERLKNDSSKDVRVAAASALGEIGDPRAAAPLEKATIYDKKQEVRDAAGQALTRMPREVPVETAPALSEPVLGPAEPAIGPAEPAIGPAEPALVPPAGSTATPTSSRVWNAVPTERVPPPPAPAFSSSPGFTDRP